MIRRINLFAGPGAGKSTMAIHLFGRLKTQHRNVELVQEYVKGWAYQNRKPRSHDQVYLIAKQIKAEDDLLNSNLEALITDSPVMLSAAYAEYYGYRGARHLAALAKEFDKDFPALNFFISRTVPYKHQGRYQTEAEAISFDKFLLDFLGKHLQPLPIWIKVDDLEGALSFINLHCNFSQPSYPVEETGRTVITTPIAKEAPPCQEIPVWLL